jgi:hypothetical protein
VSTKGLGGFGVKPRWQRSNLTVWCQLAVRREASLKKSILKFFIVHRESTMATTPTQQTNNKKHNTILALLVVMFDVEEGSRTVVGSSSTA